MTEFFEAIKPLFGTFSQSQVDGLNVLLEATKDLPITHRAYLFATTFHETAKTMQPIYERGKKEYFNKYEPSTKIGKQLGNIKVGDGYLYRGRGYVQLTGRANYTKATTKLNINLIDTPDNALIPEIAAAILIKGCTEGWFTGKKLSDYTDYVNMRRIVNGTDQAEKIAGYAKQFEEALKQGPATPIVTPTKSLLRSILDLITELLNGRKKTVS